MHLGAPTPVKNRSGAESKFRGQRTDLAPDFAPQTSTSHRVTSLPSLSLATHHRIPSHKLYAHTQCSVQLRSSECSTYTSYTSASSLASCLDLPGRKPQDHHLIVLNLTGPTCTGDPHRPFHLQSMLRITMSTLNTRSMLEMPTTSRRTFPFPLPFRRIRRHYRASFRLEPSSITCSRLASTFRCHHRHNTVHIIRTTSILCLDLALRIPLRPLRQPMDHHQQPTISSTLAFKEGMRFRPKLTPIVLPRQPCLLMITQPPLKPVDALRERQMRETTQQRMKTVGGRVWVQRYSKPLPVSRFIIFRVLDLPSYHSS